MISQKIKSASFCSFPTVLQLYFQESEQFFMSIGTASATESYTGWYTTCEGMVSVYCNKDCERIPLYTGHTMK